MTAYVFSYCEIVVYGHLGFRRCVALVIPEGGKERAKKAECLQKRHSQKHDVETILLHYDASLVRIVVPVAAPHGRPCGCG